MVIEVGDADAGIEFVVVFEFFEGEQQGRRIGTARNGDNSICLSVRDRGGGIPAENRQQLFDQFFTTKEKGLGMGLSIVRSIVESHGGKIEAENDGGGARFSFTLPID